MAQLTKGMYGREFKPIYGLFCLYCGQMRGGKNKITHNSGWYNKFGEKLGFGDLSTQDFKRISKKIKKDELFIILSESDSFWNFVTKYGPVGSMSETAPTIEAPGIDYVAEHARYVIARNQLYLVDHYGNYKNETSKLCGLQFKVLTTDATKMLMIANSTT